PIRAIQTFERSQAAFRVENNGREDPDTIFLLARAYAASKQTGQAKQQLTKFVRIAPDHIYARMMLAQLLVSEGEIKAAREHVDYLWKQAPELPELLRLKLATLDPVAAAAEGKKHFSDMKEHSRDERMAKLNMAMN